jgi:RNA polymerase-binding protein DksA
MLDYAQYENRLRKLRDEMTARINAIDRDVHHREAPVEKDFAEQVTQRENDDVLNALSHETKAIIQQIDRALLSIKKNEYGICTQCGNPISEARLKAIPYVTLCIDCAE